MRAGGGLMMLALMAACAPTPPPAAPPPPPAPGLERITDKPATVAIGLLGAPTLERNEPPGRMLQFERSACVLDIYYYPPPTGGVAVARFVEARLPDGKPIGAGACAKLLLPVAPVAGAPLAAAKK